jgi:general secretion pathway protein I
MTGKRQQQAGFSLLEILIAFSILALSLGILLNIFSGGLRRAIVSEEYQKAVTIAQAKISAAGIEIPMDEGQKQGQSLDKFNWSLVMQPLNTDDVAAASEAMGIQVYEVISRVQWTAGDNDRQVKLITLKLSKKK